MNSPVKYMLAASVLFSTALILLVSKYQIPYSNDSASYIEAARNIVAGEGLMIYNRNIEPVSEDKVPLRLWPPGYPMIIAGISRLGIDENTAARLAPWLAFICMPLLFFRLFGYFFDGTAAFLTALCAAFTWPSALCSAKAWSESPYLILVLLSLICVLSAVRNNSARYAFAGGLISGFALLTRNIGWALITAVFAGLVIGLWLEARDRKALAKINLAYLAGACLVYVPYAIRNIIVFKAAVPYFLERSDRTLFENIIIFVYNLAVSFAGFKLLSVIFIVFFAVSVFILVEKLRDGAAFRALAKDDPKKFIGVVIIGLYFIFGSILLISARTKYNLDEEIGFRHLAPYNWVVVMYLSGFMILTKNGIERALKISFSKAVAALLAGFFALQAAALYGQIRISRPDLVRYGSVLGSIGEVRKLDAGAMVVSNEDALLKILAKRNVRKLKIITPAALDGEVPGEKDLFVVLYRESIKGNARWLSAKAPEGFDMISKKREYEILRRKRYPGGSL